MMSLALVKLSVTPGSIVSVTVGATVRSPAAVYGPPAAVSVVVDHSTPYRPGVATPSYGSAPWSILLGAPNRDGEFDVSRRSVGDTYSGFVEIVPVPGFKL